MGELGARISGTAERGEGLVGALGLSDVARPANELTRAEGRRTKPDRLREGLYPAMGWLAFALALALLPADEGRDAPCSRSCATAANACWIRRRRDSASGMR